MMNINNEHYKKSAIIVDGYVGETHIHKEKQAIDLCECYSFNVGNIIKYSIRASYHKDGAETNLKKALWYIERCLNQDFFEYSYEDPETLKGSEGYLTLSAFRSHYPIINALITERGVVSAVTLEKAQKLILDILGE